MIVFVNKKMTQYSSSSNLLCHNNVPHFNLMSILDGAQQRSQLDHTYTTICTQFTHTHTATSIQSWAKTEMVQKLCTFDEQISTDSHGGKLMSGNL